MIRLHYEGAGTNFERFIFQVQSSLHIQCLHFTEYFDVVKASLLTSKQSATCVQAVKSATSQLQAALMNATEWKDMEKSFR